MISSAENKLQGKELYVSDPIKDAVGKLFGKLRSWTMGRVHEVNEMTSTESLAAGDSLNSIVNLSRKYVEQMRETMGSFVAASDKADSSSPVRSSGIGAIQEQGEMLSAYLGELDVAFTSQNQVAKEALKQLSAVRRAGSHIMVVSNQARMLAVNASIEAARLSSTHGGAFGVIASEMSTFAKNMQKQSDDIVQIVDGLTKSLPIIAEMAKQLRADMEVFSQDFDKKSYEVKNVVDELQSAIADSLQEGDNKIAEILRHSQDALSHLQFQDPCAQRLNQIEADLICIDDATQQVLSTGNTDLVESLDSATSHLQASAGNVLLFDDSSANDSDDDNAALAPGELLLF